MKKLFTIFVLLTLSIVLVGQLCFAQEAKSMAVGGQISYMMFQEDYLKVEGGKYDTTYDDEFGFSIDFTYFILSNFSLEASIGYVKSDMDVELGPFKRNYGELTQIPVLFTARYHIPVNDKITPYVGGGIGYYFNDMDDGDIFDTASPGYKAYVDDDYGFHLNAGVEVALTTNWAMNFDLKYILLSTDMGYTGPVDQIDNTDIDVYTAGLGVKYYF